MSTQALQEDQLLELLLQLKKTTPEQARTILNSQPQIAYALMAVMVNINAVNMDVIQRILASYTTSQGNATEAPVLGLPPAPSVPPHLASQSVHRGSTPSHVPQPSAFPPSSYPAPPPIQPVTSHNGAPPSSSALPGLGGYVPPPVQQPLAANNPAGLPAALANLPDEHKMLVLRVASMTREEIYQMPFAERENILKLRATLGFPS